VSRKKVLDGSFLNLTVKKYDIWSTFADVVVKIKVGYFLRHGVL